MFRTPTKAATIEENMQNLSKKSNLFSQSRHYSPLILFQSQSSLGTTSKQLGNPIKPLPHQ
jgi:hypothetical protein